MTEPHERPQDTPVTASTQDPEYAQRLAALEDAWWRRLLPVQLPYRYNLRRLHLGRTLEVGCGIGRNLRHLRPHAVGIDHSTHMIDVCHERGLTAYTSDEFPGSPDDRRECFDALLLAHLLEHMTAEDGAALLDRYLPYVRVGGRVVLITPQERGFRSDATHTTFLDDTSLGALARTAGLTIDRQYSWPLPRRFGSAFAYNEFVLVATRCGGATGS